MAWEDRGGYSTELFAAEAVAIVGAHPAAAPLFLYLAFQAVRAALLWVGLLMSLKAQPWGTPGRLSPQRGADVEKFEPDHLIGLYFCEARSPQGVIVGYTPPP